MVVVRTSSKRVNKNEEMLLSESARLPCWWSQGSHRHVDLRMPRYAPDHISQDYGGPGPFQRDISAPEDVGPPRAYESSVDYAFHRRKHHARSARRTSESG